MNHLKYCCILLISLGLAGQVFAQQTKAPTLSNLQAQYQAGKNLFEEGKYALAMETMKSITEYQENNPFLEYASFYFGLCAHLQEQYAVAKNMFLQITRKYADWEKINEVHYWLAKTYFEQDEYEEAITIIQKIDGRQAQQKSLGVETQAMKEYYLDKINNQELLEDLQRKFPADKAIATKLADQITAKPYKEQNHELLDSLITTFELDPQAYFTVTQESSIKKDVYRIGVFFPFSYQHLSTEQRRQGNQLVIDLYAGIQMAVNDLNREGINIELYAYDTERDSVKTKELLKEPEMKTMDLIIGPLLSTTNPLVSNFALENRINMFNPVSSNPLVIGDNPFSFLIKPSVETLGRRAAEFALDSLPRLAPLVIYGNSLQDSLGAFSYKQRYEEEFLTGEAIMQKVNPEESASIQKMIQQMDSLGMIGHIYVSSDNGLIISNTLGGVLPMGKKIPLIGHEDWLKIRTVSYEQLEAIGANLLAPDFENHPDNLIEFREKYIKQRNTLPSEYVYEGYDAMYFLGRILHEHGIYFQKFFEDDELYESKFFAGYNYYNANDNQVVPVVTFKESELTIVNTFK